MEYVVYQHGRLLKITSLFKGETAPLPKISMFCALSQNHQ